LIAAGHSLESIREYTLRQVRGFMAAISRNQSLRDRMDALIARSSQADTKHFRQFLRTFDE
jgi:hypothetical protein